MLLSRTGPSSPPVWLKNEASPTLGSTAVAFHSYKAIYKRHIFVVHKIFKFFSPQSMRLLQLRLRWTLDGGWRHAAEDNSGQFIKKTCKDLNGPSAFWIPELKSVLKKKQKLKGFVFLYAYI